VAGEGDSVVNDAASDDVVAQDAPGDHARLNLSTTAAGFLISMVIGLWFTPFLVHSLGPAAYGLIPLATTVVSYFSLLSQTLSATLTRSISVALASGDAARANSAFGSALGVALVLAAGLSLPLAAVSWWAPVLFHMPPGAQWPARILFAIVAATFVITLASTPYQTVAFSRNRIYFNNLAAIAQTAIRVGGTALLFTLSASIVNAGLAILVSVIVALALNVLFARISAPTIRTRGLKVDAGELRALSKTSGHVLLMQLGAMLTMSCELVIANRLFGSHEAGRYAAVMQWMLLLRNATTALVVLCVPTILALAAQQRTEDLVRYTRRAMIWVAICVALPAGYLCGLSPRILAVWLGRDFGALWPIMVTQLAPLAVTATVAPLYSITLANDRVLPAAIVQIVVALAGMGLAIVMGGAAGPVWIAVGVGWSFALKEILFTPAYAASNIGVKPRRFLEPLLIAAALFVVAAGLSWGAGRLIRPDSIVMLGIVGCLVTAAYLGVVTVVARETVLEAIAVLRGRSLSPLSTLA